MLYLIPVSELLLVADGIKWLLAFGVDLLRITRQHAYIFLT